MQKEKILLPKDCSSAITPWLWIGTWSMGGEGFGRHDERESCKVLHSAAENNIRHFDTAGFYAHGKSEALLQKLIKRRREEFFISTKGGLMWEGRKVKHAASPEALRVQLTESLERLKTGYIDLYQLHWPDPRIPISESITALKDFQKEGIIRFWGVGNLNEKQIKEFLSREKNIPHQVHFNPVHRDDKILQAGRDTCINCIISPLEQGLLGNGKSASGRGGITKKDIRNRNPYFSDLKVLEWNARVNNLLEQHHLSKVSVMLMWISAQSHIHAVIPGPKKMSQLNEILRFKSEIMEDGLLASHKENRILSEHKVRDKIPEELWQFLCRGRNRM